MAGRVRAAYSLYQVFRGTPRNRALSPTELEKIAEAVCLSRGRLAGAAPIGFDPEMWVKDPYLRKWSKRRR